MGSEGAVGLFSGVSWKILGDARGCLTFSLAVVLSNRIKGLELRLLFKGIFPFVSYFIFTSSVIIFIFNNAVFPSGSVFTDLGL